MPGWMSCREGNHAGWGIRASLRAASTEWPMPSAQRKILSCDSAARYRRWAQPTLHTSAPYGLPVGLRSTRISSAMPWLRWIRSAIHSTTTANAALPSLVAYLPCRSACAGRCPT